MFRLQMVTYSSSSSYNLLCGVKATKKQVEFGSTYMWEHHKQEIELNYPVK